MEQQIIATVEINFPEGKREIEMEWKNKDEISNCDPDKVLVIPLINGDQWTGYFNGITGDETIMLESLSKSSTIGLEMHWIKGYFEEIKGE